MRILVCGGRGYPDWEEIWRALDLFHPSLLIEGGCPTGADTHAREWANRRGAPHVRVNAEWRRYGRAAGSRRNARMLIEHKPGLVLAFPGGSGTRDMIRQAELAGVPVLLFAPEGPRPNRKESARAPASR